MSSPKISIIIPVYNSQNTLKRCFDSILKQELCDIEIICVNDCSTDLSEEVLFEYASKDSRIMIVNNERNSGPGISRNRGLAVAKGEYVAFVDADDCIAENMLVKCYNKAKEVDTDVLVFNYMTFDSDTNIIKKEFSVPYVVKKKIGEFVTTDEISNYIFNIFHVCVWNKIYKRKFIVENNIVFPEVNYAEDLYFNLLALALAKNIAYIDDYLYYYTVNQADSASSVDKVKNNYLSSYMAIKLCRYELVDRMLLDKYEKSLDLLLFENVNCLIPILGSCAENLIEVIRSENYFECAKYISTSVKKNHMNRFAKNKDKICRFFEAYSDNCSICLWGLALRGQAFLEVVSKENIVIKYLVDNDKLKYGNKLGNVKIKKYDEIKDKIDLIIVTNSYFYETILEETDGSVEVVDMNSYLNFEISLEECFNNKENVL